MGAFCSWGCMKSFNLDRNGVNQGGIIAQNILVMRKQMCQEPMKPIRAAPSRFALKEFGGTMTIEEFRSVGDATGHVVAAPNELQCVTQPKYESKAAADTRVEKIQTINDSTTSNETLKLKRPRPLKREENNLETSLGIIRRKV